MGFDFTPDETDNALLLREVVGMTNEELMDRYKSDMVCRGEGGDLCYNIEMPLRIVTNALAKRGLEVISLPQDKRIHGFIMQVDTPESSSLEGYGYDYYMHTLYVKYRSNGKVYPFYEVPTDRFEEFRASESKGKEVSKFRKEYANKTKE